jgi:hypothetical protein
LPESTAQLRRVTAFLSKRCQPRCHGSGAFLGVPRQASSIVIAHHGGFAPTRSARTPHVVSSSP